MQHSSRQVDFCENKSPSTACPGGCDESENADFFAVAPYSVKLDLAVDESKKRIILALGDVLAGMDMRTALTNEDIAREHFLTVRSLDAEALRLGIASVFC